MHFYLHFLMCRLFALGACQDHINTKENIHYVEYRFAIVQGAHEVLLS